MAAGKPETVGRSVVCSAPGGPAPGSSLISWGAAGFW